MGDSCCGPEVIESSAQEKDHLNGTLRMTMILVGPVAGNSRTTGRSEDQAELSCGLWMECSFLRARGFKLWAGPVSTSS